VRALTFVVAAILSASALRQGRPPAACPAPAPEPAESLVAEGRYWHAMRAAPPLPGSRDVPAAADLLLQLRIAEGLGQYSRIAPLLERAGGLDTVPELLAIAARQDERERRWTAAAAKYRRLASLRSASALLRATAASRLPLALGHEGSSAAAAAAWDSAALALPAVGDWFELHRALGESDTTSALGALAAAATPGVARLADSLVAFRRESSGDLVGALAAYLRGGWALEAARVELALGRTAAARGRADSVLLLEPPQPAALEAARFLAARFPHLTTSEVAGIARVDAANGRLGAAERWLLRAVIPRDTSLAPRLELAAIRLRRGRFRGALAALDDALRSRHLPLAAEPAPVTRVRVEILGAAARWREAAALIERAVRDAPGDSDVAAAVLLLSEHQRSVAAIEEERALYRTLLQRFGATRAGAIARFRLALAEYVSGRRDTAESLLAAGPSDTTARELARAWRYWAARLRLERRDPTAPEALRALAAESATDYYGVRALELLGDSLPLAADTIPPAAAGPLPASRARERIIILAHVGLEDEARAEARGWLGVPGVPVQVLIEAARGAAAAQLAPEAMLLAEAARRRSGLTAGVAHALFPFPYRRVIEAEGAEQCVDPRLLAAVIRQESRFQVRARSRAGARGLTQVLPRTGAEMSRLLHLRPWTPRLLDVPDFNVHLGARYIRDRELRDSLPLHALIASYNAGRTGVTRWRGRPEFGDGDLFIERLPSSGIADYVRNVYVNYAWYRRLYASAGGARP
jgi:soluble lytic murein transglycosylase-like protein